MTDKLKFKFRNLEITSEALVLHFYDNKITIPLNAIEGYHLDWHFHDPVFAKKWWFLVLTVELKDGREESGPIASVKFNYLDDCHSRQHIEHTINAALDAAIARSAFVARHAAIIPSSRRSWSSKRSTAYL